MIIHRPNSSIVLLAASILVASAALIAQTPPKTPAPATPAPPTRPPAPEEYTGTTINMAAGAGTNLSIQVLRWSADADRDKVVAAVTAPADKESDLAKTLQEIPTVGYIWTGGSLGYTLRYAHRQTLPDGTEQVVVMTDRPLGSWDRSGPWKASAGATEPERPVTIIEMRVNKAGIGQGKMSLSTPFAPDEKTKALGLVNYAAATVLLKDVKHKAAPRQS